MSAEMHSVLVNEEFDRAAAIMVSSTGRGNTNIVEL